MHTSNDPLNSGTQGRFSLTFPNGTTHQPDQHTSSKGDNSEIHTGELFSTENKFGHEMAGRNYQPLTEQNLRTDDLTKSNMDAETGFTVAKRDQEVVISTPEEVEGGLSLRSHLVSMWYLVVIIITPIIFLPIILSVDEEFQRQARCGYTIAVMAVYWTTEALPIAVTSLLPVVLLPALGVLSARDTSGVYFNDTSMLFVGGLLVAIAIEVWDVHKRIALLVLRVVGAEPKCLLLGITLVTWFLSMWISNTATTAMMMTIVQALVTQFQAIQDTPTAGQSSDLTIDSPAGYGTIEGPPSSRGDAPVKQEEDRKERGQTEAEFTRLRKALSISVAYAANIGGTASLTGTGPNLVLFASAQKVFESVGLVSPITFATWLVYGLPLSLLLVMAMWLWMNIVFLRCKGGCRCCCCSPVTNSEQIKRVNKMMEEEYRKLGPITYAQATVLVSFALLVIMWIARDVGGAGGWADWFPSGFVSDSTPSLLMGILMFVLPATFPASFINKCDSTASYVPVRPLLSWKHVHEKMPWSLFLLLGGGYALARAATDSGLSAWLGDQLLVLRDLDPWAILLIICYIVTFATEVTSNTAMATLMMPILSQMAISLQLNPLFLMFPAALATSFAFMLPVATPPNAIVFSHGHVRVIDMVGSGLFLNILCVPVLLLATATWGNAFFGFDQTPVQFLTNTTLANVTTNAR